MARAVNRAGGEGAAASPPEVPKTKPQRDDDKVTFRSPHRGLQVRVKPDVRHDYGAGSYSIDPPGMVEFEDRGGYGEAVVDPDTAEVLRGMAADRVNRGLPPKYVEVT